MMASRPIDASEFMRVENHPPVGPAPMLQWLRVEDLVVDEAYQRPIYGAGRTNVRRIAENFRWSKFAPVIVAPVEGGKFAVIDGQHRTTAAALIGIESIPAQVIIADATEQAAAFKSINGQVTRVNALSLHHAAIAAGDESACEIEEAAKAAGVIILAYPKQVEQLQPGETLALGSVRDGLKTYGRDVVVLALRCITETTNHQRGALAATILRAMFSVIGGNGSWRDAGDALVKVFNEIDLPLEAEEARCARRAKGTAVWEVLAGLLITRLRELLPERRAA